MLRWFLHYYIQLCLTLTVSKLTVDPYYGQYLWGTAELCSKFSQYSVNLASGHGQWF